MNENLSVIPHSGEKNKIKPLTALMLLMFVAAFAVLAIAGIGLADDSDAVTFEIDGVKYTTTSASTVSVSGNSLTSPTGLTIPSTVTDSDIQYSVTAISDRAFMSCASLTSVVIPDSVTSVGSAAFQACKSLTSATLGNGVATIGVNAFFGCSALTSIHIPSTVTSIGRDAFGVADTTNRIAALQSITVDENNKNYCSVNGVLFSKDKTTVVQYPAGKTASSYDVPDGVKTIDTYAFYGCFNLTSIILPSGVETINERGFASCTSLVSVTLPDTVTSIGDYAFSTCGALSSMNIPASVKSIGSMVFSLCYALKSVTVDENNKDFLSEDGVVFNKDKTTLVVCPPGKESSVYTVPSTVKNIADGGFYSCIGLHSVILPDGLESIGEYAFYQCRTLTSLTLGTGTPSIVAKDYPSFTGCTLLVEICNNSTLSLTKGDGGYGQIAKNAVNIYSSSSGASILKEKSLGTDTKAVYYELENVTTLVTVYGHDSSLVLPKNIDGKSYEIHDYAFCQRTLLKNVFIPSGVTKIGNYAFQLCSSLVHVDVDNTTPPAIGKNAFGTSKDVKVFVPLEANATYKDTDVWKDLDIYSYISEPKATGLSYNGNEQTGVAAAEYGEYTLGGTFKATNVGSYVATVTPNEGFMWSDNTADAKNIGWSISKKEVTVSGITANLKYYDGTNKAVLDYSKAVLAGVAAGETVTVTADGTFSDIYIGTGKTVSISDIALSGKDVGNYCLASTGQQTSTNADIRGTLTFEYENGSRIGDVITRVESEPTDEPKLTLEANEIVAGWYNGNTLWNFADKVKVTMTLVVKISKIESGAVVVDAKDKNAVDVELKTGTTKVTAKVSNGAVTVDNLSSTDRLNISIEKVTTSSDRFDVTVKLGGSAYTSKISITLNYEKSKGVPSVYYYPSSGDRVKMDASINESESTVTFTTDHNSEYGIDYSASGGGNNLALIIGIVIDVILALVIIVIALRYRH